MIQRRALVLLYQGCTIAEVVELATRLVDADVEVVYGATNLEPIRDRSGLTVQPDVIIDQVDPAEVAVLIVPGGDPEAIIDDPSVATLLGAVARADGLVAGICAGVLVMASAGLTAGRSITHNYRAPWAPDGVVDFVGRFWDGAAVEPDPAVGVVVDGPIVTALPNATIELTTTVCRLLGLYTTERAEQIGRHLRGQHVTELYRRS